MYAMLPPVVHAANRSAASAAAPRSPGSATTLRSPWIALVCALLLGACATPVQPFRAGLLPGEIVHQDSGFTFPSRLGSFVRTNGRQYDAQGRDISVGYNGEIPVIVTVYVYPASGRSVEADLAQHSSDILATYPGSKMLGKRAAVVSPRSVPAQVVSFEFVASFQGAEQPMHSDLVLAQHGARFVKYRITYPESMADLGALDSGRFLQYFAWPPEENRVTVR